MLFFCYYFCLILSGAPVSAHLYSSKRRAKTPESQYFFMTDILSPRRCRFANVSKQYATPCTESGKTTRTGVIQKAVRKKREAPG